MPSLALSAALQREHREIDSEIETFIEKLDCGSVQPEPLAAAVEALRRHIYLEEVFLFPPIRETGMVMPIFVMMREHGQLWRTMDTRKALSADRKRPPAAERIPAVSCWINSTSTTPKRNQSFIHMSTPTCHHRRPPNSRSSSRLAALPMDGSASKYVGEAQSDNDFRRNSPTTPPG